MCALRKNFNHRSVKKGKSIGKGVEMKVAEEKWPPQGRPKQPC